jgi:hypothetical protein
MTSIKERQIDLKLGAITIPHPKEKQPKMAWLAPDDIELLEQIPRGLPDLQFFRHPKGISGCKAGQPYGQRYLYKWWKKACADLGLKGVDLYGGTRHSTTTALDEQVTPEKIQDATGHASKAFRRYFQGEQKRAVKATAAIKNLCRQHFGGDETWQAIEISVVNGGGGGSRTRVRKHSTQASTYLSWILSLASCDSSRQDAQSASPLNFAAPAAGAPDQLSR